MLARKTNTPGFDGKFELAEASVQNPYDPRGGYEDVVRNIRECPTDQMYARGQIDNAQEEAARLYRALVEASEGGSHGVVDTSYEPVDRSPQRDSALTDRRRQAAQKLHEISAVVGKESEAMLRAIAGEGVPVYVYTQRWTGRERPSDFEKKYIGRRYRDALTELAVFFRLAST